MKLILFTRAEQVANHMRQQISVGRWKDALPGVAALGKEIGVNVSTMNAALQILEKEGLLITQGSGKGRKIKQTINTRPKHYLIRILLYHVDDLKSAYLLKLLSELQAAGFRVEFSTKTLSSMKMNTSAVSRLVAQTTADAWIVLAGSSGILQWFAKQEFPAFALFGQIYDTELAYSGPLKGQAIREAVRSLYQLGHRRIVYLTWHDNQNSDPRTPIGIFLNELNELGLKTSTYNIPQWEGSVEGLYDALDKLFSLSPPTAMFIESELLFTAVERYLAGKKIVSPTDISLVCTEPHPSSAWCLQATACIEFDSDQWVKRIINWVKNVSRGKEDKQRVMFPSKFIEGDTIGPVAKRT